MASSLSSKQSRQNSKQTQSKPSGSRRREIKTCARCRFRKVICDKERPCDICVSRNETHLCVDVEPSKARKQINRTVSPSGTAQKRPRADSVDEDTIVLSPVAPEVSLSSEDLIDLLATYNDACTWKAPTVDVPKQASILQALLPNNEFELPPSLASSISRLATRPTPTALMYAILALGAQHSTWNAERRDKVTRWCLTRSVSELRASEYRRKPTLEKVQCLLILASIHCDNSQLEFACDLLCRTKQLARALGIFHGQTKALQQSHRKILDAMDWQDTVLSLCMQPTPAVFKEPETLHEPSGYREVMIQVSRKIALTLQSQELKSLQPADVLSRIYEVQNFFQNLQMQLGQSETTPNVLIQQSAILVHTSHFITQLCQRVLVFVSHHDTGLLEDTDQKFAHSELTRLCIDHALTAVKEYSWLLRLECTNIAVRSYHLMFNGFGSALLLAALGELRKNSNAQSTVQELLLHASSLVPTFIDPILQRLRNFIAQTTSDHGQDLFEPLDSPDIQSTRILETPKATSSGNQTISKSATLRARVSSDEEAHQLAHQLEGDIQDRSVVFMGEQQRLPYHQSPRLKDLDPHMPNCYDATRVSTSRHGFTSVLEDYDRYGTTPAQHPLGQLAEDGLRAQGGSGTDVEDLGVDNEFSFFNLAGNDGNPGHFNEAATLTE